jgi:hypothetical protein
MSWTVPGSFVRVSTVTAAKPGPTVASLHAHRTAGTVAVRKFALEAGRVCQSRAGSASVNGVRGGWVSTSHSGVVLRQASGRPVASDGNDCVVAAAGERQAALP